MTQSPARDGNQRNALIFLFLAPIAWGVSFPASKVALGALPAFPFMAWNRLLGFLTVFCALPWIARKQVSWAALRRVALPGVFLGGLLFVSFTLQTWGIQRTTATNAGFITGLYVVVTPVLMLVLFREPAGKWVWASVAISVVGLGLLSMLQPRLSKPGLGDLLVLGGTLGWATHVITMGKLAPKHPVVLLALAQVGATTLMHVVAAVPSGAHVQAAGSVWPALLVAGVLGSGIGYAAQAMAQTQITPSRAAIVLAGESVVAAVSSAIWLGERLKPHQILGAALLVAAMVLSELRARRPEAARLDAGAAP